MAIDTLAAGIRVIAVSGALDASAGSRLLRLLDSQFALARSGHRPLAVVIVDVAALDALDRAGAAALAHARYACARRGIMIMLVGTATVRAGLGVSDRVRGFSTFPTLDAAVAAARDAAP